MSDRYKVPPMGSHDQEPAAGNGIAVMKDGLNWKADELTVSAIVLPGLSKP